jgi:branched-chain amino acid transport system permease protein
LTTLLGFVAAFVAILAVNGTAMAQNGEETVGGTMRAKDAAGEKIFIEGVEFSVVDVDGNEVGTATTNAEGVWLVELPGPGVYSVLLDTETLQGFELRNPDKNPLNWGRGAALDKQKHVVPVG